MHTTTSLHRASGRLRPVAPHPCKPGKGLEVHLFKANLPRTVRDSLSHLIKPGAVVAVERREVVWAVLVYKAMAALPTWPSRADAIHCYKKRVAQWSPRKDTHYPHLQHTSHITRTLFRQTTIRLPTND